MYDIAVVIPTHNRAELLKRTLELLNEQTYPADRYEVIVVDDGSTDDTEGSVRSFRRRSAYKLNYIRQDHRGPAAARNMGIKKADAKFIFFTGDDIFPEKDLISQHMNSLVLHPDCAVLGYVDWWQEQEITDFMKYVAPNGLQFRFNTIKDPADCDYKHFYTSNISLGKQWLMENMFDEDFPYGALEDTELAYRLKKKGLKIIFNNKAVGHHCHQMTFSSFCVRMRLTGVSSVILFKKHPELKSSLLPIDSKLAAPIFSILAKLTFMRKMNMKLYWLFGITNSYLEGVKEVLRKQWL